MDAPRFSHPGVTTLKDSETIETLMALGMTCLEDNARRQAPKAPEPLNDLGHQHFGNHGVGGPCEYFDECFFVCPSYADWDLGQVVETMTHPCLHRRQGHGSPTVDPELGHGPDAGWDVEQALLVAPSSGVEVLGDDVNGVAK